MAYLTYHKLSPFYQFGYYGPAPDDPTFKNRKFSTRIPISAADKKIISDVQKYNKSVWNKSKSKNKFKRAKLKGTPEVRKKLKQFEQGLQELIIQHKTGVKLIQRQLTLLDAWEKFKAAKSIPGDKRSLSDRTLNGYKLSVENFIVANGNKPVISYTESDYQTFINYMLKEKNYSQNSIAKCNREIKSVWNWMIAQKLISNNIFGQQEIEQKPSAPIPYDSDLQIILNYFEEVNPDHFNTVYYLLLTGVRISTAVLQRKEWFNFDTDIAVMFNTKIRRKKPWFSFPIYNELKLHLIKMGVKGFKDDSGWLLNHLPRKWEREGIKIDFSNFKYDIKAKDSFHFWDYHIDRLFSKEEIYKKYGRIKKHYSINQLRDTFPTYCRNVLKMPFDMIQILMAHSDRKITREIYTEENVLIAKEYLDNAKFRNKTG